MENDIINLQETMSVLSCDLPAAIGILDSFIASSKIEVPLLTAAYEKNDIPETRELLHKMKGALCYCRLPGLAKIVDHLHDEVKTTENLATLQPQYSAFYNEIEKIYKLYDQLKKI